jgi:hypothetical protein
MDQNRYQPPRAKVDARNGEPGPIPKAVAIGAIIDIGGTMLGSFALGLIYAVILGMQGQTAEMIQHALNNMDRWSVVGLAFTAMGTTMSMLGGFQCAVIANRTTYLAPGILSLVSVTFGAVMNDGSIELPELLFFSALTVAAILGGASLRIRKLTEPSEPPAAKD